MAIGKDALKIAGAFMTPEGGLAIRVLNKTGGVSVKGYIVEASDTTDNGVKHVSGDDIDPIGIAYESGVADGDFMWVVISGMAQVFYSASVTRATFSRVPTVGEAITAGQAINEPLPSSPFATDKHFQEIGHPIESRVGAGLAKTVLHFN